MKPSPSSSFSTLIVATLVAALPSQDPAADARRLATSLNAFAITLHGQLATAGAPTCSPASIGIALLMVLPGARGETADELTAVLELPEDLRGERLHTAAKHLLAALQPSRGKERIELRIANDVWTQLSCQLVPEYGEVLRAAFATTPHDVDFVGDPEGARKAINTAIAKATNDRIRELVPADLITPDTRIVLTNALWLRGRWLLPFADGGTTEAPFTRADGATVKVPLMVVSEQFACAENDRWQVVRLPFIGGEHVVDVLVPRAGVALSGAERDLLAGTYVQALRKAQAKVELPRFTLRAQHRLREALQALGIRAAFDRGRADFTGMRAERDVLIDDVVHETWIAVDEHGAEAAAATAVVMKWLSAPAEPPVHIRADRPFAFVLRHVPTGLVLFAGRVDDPTAR